MHSHCSVVTLHKAEGSGPRSQGYDEDMLALVVVPLVVLLVACLMERLEARVAPPIVDAPATPRRVTAGDVAPAAPARRHLRAVPALTPGGAADETTEESWSRAS